MHELVARLRAAGCVFAEEEAAILSEAAQGDRLEELVSRRVAGEPLEYVVGWVDFAGVRVGLEPGVFIPRQRTAFLVELAAAAAAAVPGCVLVDVCCGSGALGLAVAHRVPGVALHAADVDPVAVDCATRNLQQVGGRTWLGDLLDPLPTQLRGQVDVLLGNVPYVPTDAIARMPVEAREHEPRTTIDGGADGLDVLRRLAAQAVEWLAPGGMLLTEAADEQAPAAAGALESAGLLAGIHHDPEREATVVIGRRDTHG